jgi:N-acetylglucosamine-6-phosphate deacetylase
MSADFALGAERIFDGVRWHDDAVLLVRGGRCEGIVGSATVPPDLPFRGRVAGMLVPGFVDLQVNGGGGLMLDGNADVGTIRTICAAHAQFGTTALLPTLITDTPDATAHVVSIGEQAAREGVPGFAGLHLEGPHLSLARKGAHDPALIRPMTQADEAFLVEARRRLPALLVTLAPESVQPRQLAALAAAGVVVSLGHTDTGHAGARACVEAGATMATHLFNAMSQLGNREPGMVGTVLDEGRLWAGVIADGIHVDGAALGVALRAKRGPARIFLVTDAMATLGTDAAGFQLNGRRVMRADGRLTLEDGTLAGADLDMISAVRFVHSRLGLPLDEALRMASLYPAQAMGLDGRHGRLGIGTRADFVQLDSDLQIRAVWVGGRKRDA